MKKLFPLIIALYLIPYTLCLFSCNCKKKATSETITITTTPEVKRDFEKEGYVKAMVISNDIDACRYLLKLADETVLESNKIPVEFQNNKMLVWIKFGYKKNAVSTCMSGKIIDLVDIQFRK